MRAKLARGSRRRIALGQHMLVSEAIADRVIAVCSLSPGNRVLEIGTGFGILTRRLAESKALVTSYEIDEQIFEQTKKSFVQ
ncbi:MAG TPA: rRNA adenine N-6-methyltransferase family protein, partial [Bacteroidota bacterium]|nr:rRNA adenine N-6-methyltransferase family protein [Bacteroidota bacterium]